MMSKDNPPQMFRDIPQSRGRNGGWAPGALSNGSPELVDIVPAARLSIGTPLCHRFPMTAIDDIAARVAALPERVNGDAPLQRRGRFLDASCLFVVGEREFRLRILDGRVVEAREGPFVTPSADFAIIGAAPVWARMLAAEPVPGDHDILAFVKRREIRLAGDLHPLMSRLLYWKALLGHLR